jgi:hypothetical protein
MTKRAKVLIFNIIILILVVVLLLRYCGRDKSKTYSQSEFDQFKKTESDKEQRYKDTIDFIKGERDLWAVKADSRQERIWGLESRFNELSKKHEETKKGLIIPSEWRQAISTDSGYIGYVLAPNDYVDECEQCFKKGDSINKENKQLKFERDSYDDLMRRQSSVDSARITDLNRSNNIMLSKMDSIIAVDPVTRKLKFSIIGGGWQTPLSLGGGAGLIYEDKRGNAFGAHVVFTTYKPLYLFNYAKTISLRRKKK